MRSFLRSQHILPIEFRKSIARDLLTILSVFPKFWRPDLRLALPHLTVYARTLYLFSHRGCKRLFLSLLWSDIASNENSNAIAVIDFDEPRSLNSWSDDGVESAFGNIAANVDVFAKSFY